MTDTITVLADPLMLIGINPNPTGGESLFIFAPLSAVSDAIKAGLLAGKQLLTYDFNLTLNASLLTGRQTATATISGLVTTDRIVEVQPTADLPGNLSIAYAFISANNTLKVAFSTPILYTGNTSIPLRLSILR